MKPEDLCPFIAKRLLDPHIKECNMAPKSYDFEINHRTQGFEDENLRSLVAEFCRKNGGNNRLDLYSMTPIYFGGVEYLLVVTHNPGVRFIKATLTRM